MGGLPPRVFVSFRARMRAWELMNVTWHTRAARHRDNGDGDGDGSGGGDSGNHGCDGVARGGAGGANNGGSAAEAMRAFDVVGPLRQLWVSCALKPVSPRQRGPERPAWHFCRGGFFKKTLFSPLPSRPQHSPEHSLRPTSGRGTRPRAATVGGTGGGAVEAPARAAVAARPAAAPTASTATAPTASSATAASNGGFDTSAVCSGLCEPRPRDHDAPIGGRALRRSRSEELG